VQNTQNTILNTHGQSNAASCIAFEIEKIKHRTYMVNA